MKKLILSLIALLFISEMLFSQKLDDSAIIITGKRVLSKDTKTEKSARSFTIKSFNDFKPTEQYIIDGELFTDNGKYNDLVSGDGIYTSSELRPNLPKEVDPSNKYFVSENFNYNNQLSRWKPTFKISCKFRYTTQGTTILGFSCESGCIEFYDCEASIEW